VVGDEEDEGLRVGRAEVGVDGRELFFLGPNDEMMAVEMTGAGRPASAPTRLFRIPLNDITRVFESPYDVAPDGQRFLLNVPEMPTPLLISGAFNSSWIVAKSRNDLHARSPRERIAVAQVAYRRQLGGLPRAAPHIRHPRGRPRVRAGHDHG